MIPRWDWGGPRNEPHLVRDVLRRTRLFEALLESTTDAMWVKALRGSALPRDRNLDGVEPFGFADGISQPKIDWEQQRRMRRTFNWSTLT